MDNSLQVNNLGMPRYSDFLKNEKTRFWPKPITYAVVKVPVINKLPAKLTATLICIHTHDYLIIRCKYLRHGSKYLSVEICLDQRLYVRFLGYSNVILLQVGINNGEIEVEEIGGALEGHPSLRRCTRRKLGKAFRMVLF